jgi:hypothetical protein
MENYVALLEDTRCIVSFTATIASYRRQFPKPTTVTASAMPGFPFILNSRALRVILVMMKDIGGIV